MIKRILQLKVHIAIVAFFIGIFFGINISGRSSAEEDSTYKYLDYFHQVYQTIKTNFVEVPNNKNVFYGAIKGAISALNDPYSRFLDEDGYLSLKEETTGKFIGVGIEITMRDNEIVVISPIEDTPAMKAGILSEDIIIKVDDVLTKEKGLPDIIKLIKGLPHTKVKITVRREGFDEPLEYIIERVPIKIETVSFGVLKEFNNIGYLKIKVFSADTQKDVEEALKFFNKNRIDKLVVDLRWNPGGLLDQAITISNLFLEKNQLIVSTRGREGTGNISEFRAELAPVYKGRVVVLVNNGSASASEIFSGAIRDNNRGKLVGTKTFGKGSVQKFFSLDENVGVTLTIAKYYTPSGVSIHGKGIQPDFVVNAEEISKEDTDKLKIIYKDKLPEKFVKENKNYNTETQKKFLTFLKEKNLSIKAKDANFILKKEVYRYTKSPLYDLEFDNQLAEAVKVAQSKN